MFQSLAPQKVLLGGGSVEALKDIVASFGAEKVLFVTQTVLIDSGLTDRATALIREAGAEIVVSQSVPPEPEVDDVQKEFDSLDISACDLIVALGGGSVMDSAKLFSVMATNGKNVRALLPPSGKITEDALPLVVIPTTAGTGSEATPNAIVTVPEQNLKVGIVSPKMMPHTVILDYALTLKLPRSITGSTGMDALAHCVECFVSKKANPLSDTYALRGVSLIAANLKTACDEPDNAAAREAMLLAAFYGGMAISAAGTTAVHALAYPLGGKFHVPHGVSNAILLPHVFAFNAKALPEKLKTLAIQAQVAFEGDSAECAADKFVAFLYQMAKDAYIPENLRSYNITEADVDYMTAAALDVKRLMDNNPVALTGEDVAGIYRKIL